MFDNLLELPLFQGLSQDDFTNILGKIKLHFQKFKQGETIAKSSASVADLIFILKGEVEMSTTPEHNSFTYIEKLGNGHYLIEPEALFGIHPYYKSTYTAVREVSIMSIEKRYLLTTLLNYDVFRINFLNSICSRAYMGYQTNWKLPSTGPREKIIQFFVSHSEKPEGEKRIIVKMEDLAQMIDETRLNVSRALNELQQEGLIDLNRKMICIPDLGKLQG